MSPKTLVGTGLEGFGEFGYSPERIPRESEIVTRAWIFIKLGDRWWQETRKARAQVLASGKCGGRPKSLPKTDSQ